MMEGLTGSLGLDVTGHSIELREIDGYGNIGHAWGNYTETVTVMGAPQPINNVAKLQVIFRKQTDDSWVVAGEIWNTDLPLPEQYQAVRTGITVA
jgi:ketosteroid isomerase-like protein